MNIGDKVVCIDDGPCNCGCGLDMGLILNSVYIVEGFWVYASRRFKGQLGLFLVGKNEPPKHGNTKRSKIIFGAHRFRLLDHEKAINQLNKQNEY